MIPRNFIQEWRQNAPWSQDAQLEQDLIICRALVEIFSHPELAANLAFRGGTALFKLYLAPMRYSEDIDLVQITSGPIGHMMSTLQEKLNPWLGNPKRKQSEGRVTLTYRMESEDGLPLKLKIEINSREHFTLLGYSASLAGLVMMPQGFCTMISIGLAGVFAAKLNQKAVLITGITMMAGSSALMAGFNLTTDFETVVYALCLQGVSVGLIFVPVSVLSFTGVSNDKMGNATALWNLLRNIGGSVGIGIVMTLISRGAQTHQNYMVDHLTPLDKGYQLAMEKVAPLLDLKGLAGGAEASVYGQLVR